MLMRGIDDAAYLREKSYLWAANDTNVRSDYSNETLLYARTCEGAAVAEKRERKKKNPYFIAALSYSSPSTLRVCTFRNSISILFVPPRAEEEEEVDEKRKTLFRG